MANSTHLNLLFLFFSFFSCFFSCYSKVTQKKTSEIKGMFVFGSSLVDNGNNNFLQNSLAKANYLPYGKDFPFGASGRFTNGKNVIDLLGEKLNLPNYIPVFYDPSTKGDKIVHGVNYASGGSGILDDTGAIAVNVTSLNQQIRNFEKVALSDFKTKTKINPVRLSNYLFVVGSGGNDYSMNFFLGNSNLTLEAFTLKLTKTLSQQLKKLYDLGARKFVLMTVNPNGCSPVVKASNPTVKGCIESVNRAVQLFNINLRIMVDSIKRDMPGSNIVIFNSYKIMMDIIKSPNYTELSEKSNTCCEVTSIDEGGSGTLCKIGGSVCENRCNYVYFDGLHPTEAVNIVLANKAYASNDLSEVYPMNVKQLSEI